MSESAAKERSLKPRAAIVDWAAVGVPPEVMGIGPVPAIKNYWKRQIYQLIRLTYLKSMKRLPLKHLLCSANSTSIQKVKCQWRSDCAWTSCWFNGITDCHHVNARVAKTRRALWDCISMCWRWARNGHFNRKFTETEIMNARVMKVDSSSFFEHLEMVREKDDKGAVVISTTIQDIHKDEVGPTSGGLYYTLLDVTLGTAV